jgi:transposase
LRPEREDAVKARRTPARQKNDTNDAEAICTAVQQRNMRFVPKKTLEQQDMGINRGRYFLLSGQKLSARHAETPRRG